MLQSSQSCCLPGHARFLMDFEPVQVSDRILVVSLETICCHWYRHSYSDVLGSPPGRLASRPYKRSAYVDGYRMARADRVLRPSLGTRTLRRIAMLEFFGKGPGNPFLHKKGFPGTLSKFSYLKNR